MIGAGTLSLLAELADEVPVLCVVDDVHWLDQGSADALFFAARRLVADPVGMLFPVRETAGAFPAPGIESWPVSRLAPTALRATGPAGAEAG